MENVPADGDAHIETTGDGTIHVEAGGDISMADGLMIRTGGGDVRVRAAGDVNVSLVDAGTGTVGVTAVNGSILDGDAQADILAGAARLTAGLSVGGTTDPLEITVDTLSAHGGTGGINILATDIASRDVTVGWVDLSVQRVNAGGSTLQVYDPLQRGLSALDGGFVVFANDVGSITVDTTPAVAVLFPDTEEEITLIATQGGAAFNGYAIRIDDDSGITGDDAVVQYDKDNTPERLDITLNSGETTVGTLVDAINNVADFPFTAVSSGAQGRDGILTVDSAGLDYASNDGSETGASSVVQMVMSGGSDAVKASATLRPVDTEYGIAFTASVGGSATDGVTIRILDDGPGGILEDGADAAYAEYRGAERILDLYINNGYTTVGTVISVVNGDADVPFDAALTGNGALTDVLQTAPVITVANIPAVVKVSCPGGDNDLLLTAAAAGTAYNGAVIRYVDDGSVTGNVAVADPYDGVGKVLTVRVNSGVTDGAAVMAAVNAEGTFQAVLDTTDDTGNDGSGTIQSHITLTGGGGAAELAAAVVRSIGDNNDIRFEAKGPGSDLNGVTIRYIDDGSVTDGTAKAEYDSGIKTLTITIQDQFTDGLAVIDAVNNGPNRLTIPFKAYKSTSDGSGTVQGIITFTSGGGVGTAAKADVTFPGESNDIRFTAESTGADSNGVRIKFVDDGGITDGTATAVYASGTKTLTITIQAQFTTAAAVVEAVNSGPNHADIPFTAAYINDNTGIGGIVSIPEATAAGGVSSTAQATVSADGADNDLVFRAKAAGVQYAGVRILFIDDGSIDDGSASAVYDGSDPFDKTLIITIQNGVTTAAVVMEEVNHGDNSEDIPFVAVNAAGSDGSGAIHTHSVITGGGGDPVAASVTVNPAGDENDFVVTSLEGGMSSNGINVLLVHDGDHNGAPVVSYDALDETTRILTITLNNDEDITAAQVIQAINDGDDLLVPFSAAPAAEGVDQGAITTAAVPYNALSGPGYVGLSAAQDILTGAVVSSGAGAVVLEADGDIIFSSATGAVEAGRAVVLDAGGSIANTASTASVTVSGGLPGVQLTSDDTDIPSEQDFVVDSRGGFVLGGAGLALSGADLTVTADDDLSIQAGASINAPGRTVLLSAEDDVDIAASIIAGNIGVTAGTDGSGDVTFTAELTGGGVNIVAADNVDQGANIAVSGDSTVSVHAVTGDITMTDGTATTSVDGAVSYEAGGDILLSLIESTGINIPFTAVVDGVLDTNNDGTGGFRNDAVHVAVTAGGSDTTGPAYVVVRPGGGDNDIRFEAESDGTSLNGVTIRLVDDGTIDDGGALAEYDDSNPDYRLLTITVQDGVTTAARVIEEVNEGANSGAIPFSAGNADGNNGSGVIQLQDVVTAGGSDETSPASAVVVSGGDDNDVRFIADNDGTSLNGVTIRFVDDGSITDGSAVASYDSGTKTPDDSYRRRCHHCLHGNR